MHLFTEGYCELICSNKKTRIVPLSKSILIELKVQKYIKKENDNE